MTKIAIFVEGQSEQIFVRHLLLKTCDLGRISFDCRQLYADHITKVPFDYNNPNADVRFLLIDVGCDERVLTAVRDREQLMFERGFHRIIALRDMYCQAYRKRSPNVISDEVAQAFIDGALETVSTMSNPSNISIHFSIMELEAWLLGMHHMFERLDSRLTVDHIHERLGFRLPDIDPQKRFYRPANDLDKILRLIGSRYRKTRDDMERICSRIDATDFAHAMGGGRCASFRGFYEEIHTSCN